jgi:SNF2 family DNA or RNA helicase
LVDENLRGPLWADDMGLGKTIQALTVSAAYQRKYDDKVFVVCPATLKDNWLIESDIVGVEIEVFSWAKQPEPLEYDRYVLVCDEAHYAQNSKSIRGKQFLKLSQHPNCRAVIPLSGTPMKSGRPINLYPLLKAINHPVAKNSGEYQKRYCAAGYRNIGRKQIWDNSGASHLDELNTRIADCMIRRKKKEVLSDLPDKQTVMRKAEVTGDRLKGWKKAVSEAQKEYDLLKQKQEETGVETAAKLVLMTRLRVANSIAKVDAAIEYAEEVLEQGEPIVLFTDFVPSAQELYLHLSKQYPCELLTGETPIADRQAMKERFQAGESKVFISTIKAGGVGITLTAASTVVLVDRPWNPGDAEQAADRCYRIGQKNSVLATWLQHSEVDEWVDAVLINKEEIIKKVFSGKRKTMRGAKSPHDIVNDLLKAILG